MKTSNKERSMVVMPVNKNAPDESGANAKDFQQKWQLVGFPSAP
jgi:hypothetical protein